MRTYKIKEIAQIINGSTPSTKNKAYWNGNIVWITPSDLSSFNGKYIYTSNKLITKEGYDSCSTTLVPKGTVLLSSKASIGYLAIAGVELCTSQGFKSLVCNPALINNEYMYYWLSTKIKFFNSISSGAVMKELTTDILENINIELPNFNTQQHIVNIRGI
ncbi:restriction endonuclease subunit S [Mycoplasmopsis bovirhinis]|uniref:EcoKI restriction-modification system protein HsdS n=1 Tax=Mycoplasmopsis bovirhinis TaxID=29553 RepID=A0A449AH12_9BACT|nr:restriction endonuclease subunit S [Mycoplasmopsis bovirhinis]VEU63224.1 EcoKI restriction-modification system protein HsdS [Mycoplasmopsis bovirhinis]VEU64253.1 EcoKI restriction-modification system protein HsdS [Mycoplasmopsis bovirhinis]